MSWIRNWIGRSRNHESKAENAGSPDQIKLKGENLLPRVVAADFLRNFPAEAALPARPVVTTGLMEILVLDSDESMVFVTNSMLEQLGLTEAKAFDDARKNLQSRVPVSLVRGVLEQNQMPMIKTCDGFDAARILVLPGFLKDGEVVAAMIPDRDTLVLLAVPPEKEQSEFWQGLADFPGSGDSSPTISNRPFRVSRQGIQMM